MILHVLVNNFASPEFVVQETVRYKFSRLVVLGLVMMDCPGISNEDGAFG